MMDYISSLNRIDAAKSAEKWNDPFFNEGVRLFKQWGNIGKPSDLQQGMSFFNKWLKKYKLDPNDALKFKKVLFTYGMPTFEGATFRPRWDETKNELTIMPETSQPVSSGQVPLPGTPYTGSSAEGNEPRKKWSISPDEAGKVPFWKKVGTNIEKISKPKE